MTIMAVVMCVLCGAAYGTNGNVEYTRRMAVENGGWLFLNGRGFCVSHQMLSGAGSSGGGVVLLTEAGTYDALTIGVDVSAPLIRIECWAAGGMGGEGYSQSGSGGAGGGGGGYAAGSVTGGIYSGGGSMVVGVAGTNTTATLTTGSRTLTATPGRAHDYVLDPRGGGSGSTSAGWTDPVTAAGQDGNLQSLEAAGGSGGNAGGRNGAGTGPLGGQGGQSLGEAGEPGNSPGGGGGGGAVGFGLAGAGGSARIRISW